MPVDQTLALLLCGYTWLPALRRRCRDGDGAVRTRLLGRPALVLRGPEAVRFFYDERHALRGGALPGPVLDTLVGRGAVHTLDGRDHRVRKALLLSRLTDPAAVETLSDHVRSEFRERFDRLYGREVALFDEVALVLARAVAGWAGLPDRDDCSVGRLARDCVAMVDGFAAPGPRHLRARRARARQEGLLSGAVVRAREEAPCEPPAGLPDPPIHLASPVPSAPPTSSAPYGPPAPYVVPAARVTPFDAVVAHQEADGRLLDPTTAAVELLDIVRPAVAITWLVTFAAHALHTRPTVRRRLAEGDRDFAVSFAHEVRRFYPFIPFVGALARGGPGPAPGERVPAGTLLLLDVYGQNHDPGLWDEPYRFVADRFVDAPPDPDTLIPQGGGPREGHRCPGEDITVAVLSGLAQELARLGFAVPGQDLRISLRRVPTRPREGFRMLVVARPRAPAGRDGRSRRRGRGRRAGSDD